MKKTDFYKEYGHIHEKRFQKTLVFMNGLVNESDQILDIGPVNPFSKIMLKEGFSVTNTDASKDLDMEFDIVKQDNFDVVTAFEIFEHLVSPFPLLRAIKAKKLFASVPLNLWFAKAYWNEDDPYDRHYHEFEPRQFDMLLEKAGWNIVKSEQWVNPSNKISLRGILRKFTPRHYIVYCEKK